MVNIYTVMVREILRRSELIQNCLWIMDLVMFSSVCRFKKEYFEYQVLSLKT